MNKKNFWILLLLTACNANDPNSTETKKDTVVVHDTVTVEKQNSESKTEEPKPAPQKPAPSKVYANERFKDVTVEKTGEHQFLVKGKGQIFEASFSWVVEDGHEELKQGHTMTDAGAPEWGNFNFTIDVPKKRANSTLHLILFEASAKDGSRQYELPVLLY
jgi:hypothetical protein